MEFKRGADVYIADGDKVGEVERVVLDPRTKDVTHIIVEKGILFTEDKVVPVDWVERATGDRVTLQATLDEEEIEALPRYEGYDFLPLTPAEVPDYEEGYPHPMYWYPSSGVAWWNNPGIRGVYSRPAYVVEEEENIPEGTIALKEGADVVAADGEKVGEVERVLTDPDEERATHLVISQGVLFPDKKLIPTTWINAVEEDRVLLAVGSPLLESARSYED